MGDDYEILDPIKTDAKTDDEAKTGPPSTPMLSSIKQPINTIATGPTIGGSRKESGKSKVKGKAILRKKDVEIEVEEQKQSKKSDNKRLSDKVGKQLAEKVSDKKIL
uniref:Bm9153 n=1 Tax=Brugia malayi TaxID=6279 RepID=A0A0H5SHJ9_BRUMA|nr:Bm9153 [Brugia malayi]